MKALKIWIAMLTFNCFAAFILYSGIFPSTYGQPVNYEPSFQNSATNGLNFTISTNNNDAQQYSASANILNIIRQGITFDWVFVYLPHQFMEIDPSTGLYYAPNIADPVHGIRAFLLAMAIVINSAMIIELWTKFRDPLE